MKYLGRASGGFILLVLLFSCASLEEEEKGPLQGMIFNTGNRPEADVSVILDEGETIYTDINGHFYFPDITKGEHLLSMKKEGFESVEVSFNFYDFKHVFYTQIISLASLVDEAAESLALGDFEEAEGYLMRVEALDPTAPDYLFILSAYYFKTGQLQKAVEEINLLIEKGQHQAEILSLKEKINEALAASAREEGDLL